jgi:4,5-dihydroxyphthalate decarboxylase
MTAAKPLPLKIAIATYGHTAALKNGGVAIEGVQADFIEVVPIIAAFRRMVRDVEFDVCEMAPATYMIARSLGAPFKALPVFIMRSFHHGGFVYREDAGIRAPKDLAGKRAGVRAWSVSTGIWTRGILQNEYGVDISGITWVVDDEEHLRELKLPANVMHAPPGKSLVGMMASGELAAAHTGRAGIGRAGAPVRGWEDGAAAAALNYPELFPDAARLEEEWYRRTGIYPVHGLIVVKQEILEREPWVARALFDAFAAAKDLYVGRLASGRVENDTDRSYRRLSAIVGDPLPYGIEANRPAIETLITYCHQQGLLPRRYAIGEMFVDLNP